MVNRLINNHYHHNQSRSPFIIDHHQWSTATNDKKFNLLLSINHQQSSYSSINLHHPWSSMITGQFYKTINQSLISSIYHKSIISVITIIIIIRIMTDITINQSSSMAVNYHQMQTNWSSPKSISINDHQSNIIINYNHQDNHKEWPSPWLIKITIINQPSAIIIIIINHHESSNHQQGHESWWSIIIRSKIIILTNIIMISLSLLLPLCCLNHLWYIATKYIFLFTIV